VTLGVAAASLATAAALVPAWLGRVGAWWAVRGVDAAVVSMTALPGVVVGLAFVVMGARVLPALHHTVHLLLLAYVLRFLGQAATSLSTGFGPHTTRLHEAARSLGHGPVVGWLRGVLPAARPAFVAAWLAVFLSVIKELPATLLLRPPGTSTLAVRVWSLTQDAFFTAASPTVLLLMLLAFAALTLSPIQSGARRSGGVHG
jgi:iron(III) transport system permease protein